MGASGYVGILPKAGVHAAGLHLFSLMDCTNGYQYQRFMWPVGSNIGVIMVQGGKEHMEARSGGRWKGG